MSGAQLRLEVGDDGIAVMTFDNPGKRNALSTEIRTALPGALAELRDDDAVRVVVVTGAGDEAFVSGADISEFGDRRTSPEARAEYDRVGREAALGWARLEKPVLAMIRGWCVGGGVLTALQADIRIASDDARFAVPAARLGVGYAYDGVRALVEVVGAAWTSEILLTGRRLSAAEALAIGLVNRVVRPERLEEEVWALARSVAGNAPLTLRACKVAIRHALRLAGSSGPDGVDGSGGSGGSGLDRIHELVEACFRSDDYREGQRAFAEKRRPRFTGR